MTNNLPCWTLQDKKKRIINQTFHMSKLETSKVSFSVSNSVFLHWSDFGICRKQSCTYHTSFEGQHLVLLVLVLYKYYCYFFSMSMSSSLSF